MFFGTKQHHKMTKMIKTFINDWIILFKVCVLMFCKAVLFDNCNSFHRKILDDFNESYDRIIKYLFVYNVGFVVFVVFVSAYIYLEKIHAI